jgi:type IV pilus assembly protein PilM
MKDLVYKKKDVLGLDIGTSNVKYVQLKEKGKLTKLIGYGHFKVPENIIIEGIITEPEKLAKIVKEELANPPWGKITASRVVTALPDSKLFTHVLELPVLSEKEIENAVNLEIDQSIPVAASDLYTDWQIVSEANNKMFVFMAAAPKIIVDSYIQFFNLVSMEPMAFEISLAAISRAVIAEKDSQDLVLIVDIGGQTTNMAIYDKGIQVAGSHPVGAESIGETLKTVLSLNEKEVEDSLQLGLNNETKSAEVIKNDLKKILVEAERMIQYYKEKRDSRTISKMIICGGLGAMTGLAEFFEEDIKIKTTVGNPWSNISIYPLKPVPKRDAPMFSAAIGLSLRGLRDE